MNFTLITGASSGIGKELAIEFSANKRNLILVARRKEKLVALAERLKSDNDIQVIVIALDLALPNASETLFNYIKENALVVDLFINNAGFGLQGDFKTNSISKINELADLNIKALVSLSHAYLNYIGSSKGHLVQLASTAAFFPGPHMAVYYASKAFVLSFSRALRNELEHSQCAISVICPGPVSTEFQQVAEIDSDVFKKKAGLAMISASSLAKYVYKKINQKKFLIIPGFVNKVSVLFAPITPVWLSNKIINRLHS